MNVERETANGYLFQNYRKPWLIQRVRGCFATQVLSLSFECEFFNELEL